jgi:uncharacterized protein YukE
MGAADIYLDLDQLNTDIIDQNKIKLQEIDSAMKSACNAVASLTSKGWQGESKDAFIEKFSEYKQSMRIFCEYVKEFNNQLKIIKDNGRKLITQGNKIVNRL